MKDEEEAPFVSESALLFKALLDKLMQGGEYCEDLEGALKDLRKDPEIIERINSYNFAETTAVGNPKFYDI